MPAPCPKNGKCLYCTRKITGTLFCVLPQCAYPLEQRLALIRTITELAVKPHRNEVEEERLQRYRAYLRELRGGGP